jgi:hypothetical protein
MDVPLIIAAAAFTVASGGAGFGFASMAFGTKVQRLRGTVKAQEHIIAERGDTIADLNARLRAQGRVIAAYRATEQRRQDQRVAASRSGHAKRAAARAGSVA